MKINFHINNFTFDLGVFFLALINFLGVEKISSNYNIFASTCNYLLWHCTNEDW